MRYKHSSKTFYLVSILFIINLIVIKFFISSIFVLAIEAECPDGFSPAECSVCKNLSEIEECKILMVDTIECQQKLGSPPIPNSCSTDTWQFNYYTGCQKRICQKEGFAGSPTCTKTFSYRYSYTQCSALDRCKGAITAGSGSDPAGKIVPGICDASKYDGHNSQSACVSGGWYKTCCKTDASGQYTGAVSACQSGLCPGNNTEINADYILNPPPPGNGCPVASPPEEYTLSVSAVCSLSNASEVSLSENISTCLGSGTTTFSKTTSTAQPQCQVSAPPESQTPGGIKCSFSQWRINDSVKTNPASFPLNSDYPLITAKAIYVQNPQCSDGIDNDGDGKIDYPADPHCSDKNDNDESDGNQTFYRCNDSNSCVSAGQYANQAACETSAGGTCYIGNTCNGECGSGYSQFYRCDGSNCKPAGRYKKTSECEAAYGAGNCYKKDSACNNECGGTTYYWCTNSNPNLCVSGATCPSRTCLTTGCPSACSSGNQYWCDANNQCQSGQSCPSQYQATCKINNCPSQCSSPPPRSVYYYCNADTNSCSSQQSTKEECEEEYGICYKQKSDCAEACEKSDPQSGGSEGEEDVSITLEVEPKCVPQNTSLDSDDPDYEGIKLNWEVSMKGNVCDQDGLSVNLPSDWSKCDEISEWQNKTPAGSGECNVAYGYLADWPNPPFSVVKSMDGLADVDPPPAVTKDYALGCKRDEYQCQWRRSCSYSCQKLCDLDCNHCVRKNPCVVADNDTEHKCCDSTCTDFQSESGLIHEGGYQFKKITLGVVQPVDFIRSLIADPLKLFRDTKETSKTRLSWGASAEDSDVNTVIKCTPSATGDDHGWQNILDSKNKSGSEELEPEKTTTYSLICRNRRATDSTCYTSKESEPPQTVEVFKKKEIKEDAPSSLRLFQNLLSFVGANWLKR